MSKKTSLPVKFSKSNLQALGKIALGTEGVLSKNTFLQYSSQNMLDKYVTNGYLKRKDGDGNYYQTTEKFNTAFRKEYGKINKDYSDCRFSANRSINHASGLEKMITAIDRRDIINDNVTITSGGTLSDNYEKFSHSNTGRDRMESLYEQHSLLVNQYTTEINELKALDNKTQENYTNLFELENQLKHSQTIVDLYESDKEFASPPDAQLTMTVDAFQTQIDNLKNELENDDLSRKEYNALSDTINQMEQYMEQVVSEERTIVTYSIEAVTNNYRSVDLIQKENYETITEQKIIYIRV